MLLLIAKSCRPKKSGPDQRVPVISPRDFRQRLKALSSEHEPVFQRGYLMLDAVPLPDQYGTGFDPALARTAIGRRASGRLPGFRERAE